MYVIGQQFIVARSAESAGRLAMELDPGLILDLLFPDVALDPEVLPKHWFLELDEVKARTWIRVPVAEVAQFFEGRTRVELSFPPLDPTFDPETGGRRAAPT